MRGRLGKDAVYRTITRSEINPLVSGGELTVSVEPYGMTSAPVAATMTTRTWPILLKLYGLTDPAFNHTKPGTLSQK